MKKILLVASLFVLSLASSAQINYSFCMTPAVSTNTDSVSMTATLLASDGYKSITWADSSGPTVAIIPAPVNTWSNTMLEQSVLTVHGLVPGTYIFKGTGVSATGNTGSLYCKVTVLPAPLPRTVTSVTLTFYGVTVTIPAAGLPSGSIKYSDGNTQ